MKYLKTAGLTVFICLQAGRWRYRISVSQIKSEEEDAADCVSPFVLPVLGLETETAQRLNIQTLPQTIFLVR